MLEDNNRNFSLPGIVDVSPRTTIELRLFLTKDNVFLTLCHDLLQHKHMMWLLQQLVLDLAEALCALRQWLDNAHHHRLSAHGATWTLCNDNDPRTEDVVERTTALLWLLDNATLVNHMNKIYSSQ